MKEVIVHCESKELWDRLQEKMLREGASWGYHGANFWDGFESCNGYIALKCDCMENPGGDQYHKAISAQEYLGKPNQLTHSQFLSYIKEHGPIKARITEDFEGYERGQVVSLDERVCGRVCSDCISIKYWMCKDWGNYYGKFELVDQPFEDKSASEQGIDVSRYFTVVNGRGHKFKIGEVIKRYANHHEDIDRALFKNDRYGGNEEDWDCVRWSELRYATQSEIDKVLGEKRKQPLRGYVCGMTEEELDEVEKFNQSIITKTMNKVTKFIQNARLSANEKLLRENGLKNECGQYSEEYKEIVTDKLYAENEPYVIEKLKATLEAEKEK